MKVVQYLDPTMVEDSAVLLLLSLKRAANTPVEQLERESSAESWGSPDDGDDAVYTEGDDGSGSPISASRGKLADKATRVLKTWLYDHSASPYPSEAEKHTLMEETGLTIVQVNNWMSNARRRILKKHRFTRPTRKAERANYV